MELNWYEKLICIALPISCGIDASLTYMFSNKDEIIARELNQIFVMAVTNNVDPFFVLLYAIMGSFLLTLLMFYILKTREAKGYRLLGANHLFIAVSLVLCITRPLAGLTWYFKSELYDTIMFGVMCGTSLMLAAVILLLIAGSLYGKKTQNEKTPETAQSNQNSG